MTNKEKQIKVQLKKRTFKLRIKSKSSVFLSDKNNNNHTSFFGRAIFVALAMSAAAFPENGEKKVALKSSM